MPLHPLLEEWDADLRGGDPLSFPGYQPPVEESVVTGRTPHYALAEGRFDVLGGSMGAVHGEKVVRAFRRARELRLPVVIVTASGGARMQEGMVSLVQMARTAGAVRDHQEAGLLSLAIHRHPTTGGVFASYGSLADLRAAEEGITIGFAGPRVVEQTLGTRLPDGLHSAESAYRAGLVDAVLPPDDLAAWVEGALGLRDRPLAADSRNWTPNSGVQFLETEGGAWAEVQRARDPARATGVDWAARLCASWTELHGPDPVVRAGLASLGGSRAIVIATDRHAGDGRPRPAGFRLAPRALALADQLGLPVLTLVDTPGAHPGPESEADGIAGEIARTFHAMDGVRTPVVSVCVGEGGSGGALALAHADRLLIQQHAVFSVIAPEGAAAILYRDAGRASEVTERLRLTATDLVELGIVDAVAPEDEDGLRRAIESAFEEAVVGRRRDRPDQATSQWLR